MDLHVHEEMEVPLIASVMSYPELYNPTCREYRVRKRRDDAWRCVASQIGVTEDDAKKRWKSLRDCYRKLRTAEREQRKGATENGKKWRFMPLLHFLEPFIFDQPRYMSPMSSPESENSEDRETSTITFKEETSAITFKEETSAMQFKEEMSAITFKEETSPIPPLCADESAVSPSTNVTSRNPISPAEERTEAATNHAPEKTTNGLEPTTKNVPSTSSSSGTGGTLPSSSTDRGNWKLGPSSLHPPSPSSVPIRTLYGKSKRPKRSEHSEEHYDLDQLQSLVMRSLPPPTDDEDKYGVYLAATLRRLPPASRQLLKVRIEQWVYQIEFGATDMDSLPS